MLSNHSLGIEDSTTFSKYWSLIKGKLTDLKNLSSNLQELYQRSTSLHKRAVKTGDNALIKEASLERGRLFQVLPTAEEVRSKLERFLPDWLAQSDVAKDYGLGIAPILIGVFGTAAIGGLAFVATRGLELLEQYKESKNALIALENKTITAEQYKATRPSPSSPASGSVGEKLKEIVAGGVGSVLIPLILFGGTVYMISIYSANRR